MRWISLGMLWALTSTLVIADDKTWHVFPFTTAHVGKLPDGWTADKTGSGNGSVWKGVVDDTAPSKSGHVLAQTAAGPNALFNLCVNEKLSLRDVELQVAFKAMRGALDQGGGLVWRYQDSNNYYLTRMNPLEDNFRVYKVVNGKRVQLATKEELKIATGTWHSQRITMKGDHIECFLDETKYLDVTDATLPKAGKVGLWTKADAQTYFDSFRVRER